VGWASSSPGAISSAAIASSPPVVAGGGAGPPERFGALRFEDALLLLRVNAVAPLLVAQRYLSPLEAGRAPRLVSISSEYGSVSGNTDGFPYYYAASKAALNMLMRSLTATRPAVRSSRCCSTRDGSAPTWAGPRRR